ncbi:MAG: glycosyltransferase family 4 protein [Bacilli bacterium]|nr:glycosyltransferase family 4 protein [Bacilli bacterium]
MKKLKIGLFTDTYPPYINGVSTSIETLKKALEELGHTVYVVAIGQDAITYNYDEKNKILKVPGIPIGLYDYRITSIYPIKIINKVKSWDLDIIHSHTEFSMGIFARLFAKQCNIPLVHTYHTMYKDYTYYISRNHKFFDLGCKKAVEYLSKFYCDNTADALIVPTTKTYHLFREEYHYNKDIYIVPTGIDAKRFYKENIDKEKKEHIRKKLGYKKNDFVVIFIGRMAQEKNIEFIIEIASILKKKKTNIKFLLVGDGPDKEKYQNISKKKNLEENITFAGRIPWEETPLYYHNANLFISCSKTETQGLTVIEAMASSLPSICINDPAFNMAVINDLNGKFFETAEEAAQIIEELQKDKKQLNVLAKQATLIGNKYSLHEFGNNIIEVYKTAIKNHDNKKDIPSIIMRIIKRKKEKKDERRKNKSDYSK